MIHSSEDFSIEIAVERVALLNRKLFKALYTLDGLIELVYLKPFLKTQKPSARYRPLP